MTKEQLELLFRTAEETSLEESSDAEMKVGAATFVEHRENQLILSTANTFVNQAKNLPNTRPAKYEYMIHAEANLVYYAARTGVSLDGRILVCTLSPCQNCIRLMFQAGIREVYYRDTYRLHNSNMADIKVTETKVGDYTHMKLENY